jgi:hypothetical protein
MRILGIFVVIAFLFADCRSKKTKLADEDTVAINEFVDFFQDVKLPFRLVDSTILKKETDSASIGYKIFTQFIPDSVLQSQFGKGVKPAIYPLGKVAIKNFETYLFLKAIVPNKKVAYVIALDKNNNFITAMPLAIEDKDPTTVQIGEMDPKYTVIRTVQKKMEDGQSNDSKKIYILNSETRAFSLIMTDEGLPEQVQDIINPIDTFQLKNKFSGDYIKDKRNYISIRDGKTTSQFLFFIHFEKDNGDCRGELKGEATLQGSKTALYRAVGNPCLLEFSLSGNTVSIRELEACGSYRDIKCFFEGSFVKKKEPKPKPATSKKSSGNR